MICALGSPGITALVASARADANACYSGIRAGGRECPWNGFTLRRETLRRSEETQRVVEQSVPELDVARVRRLVLARSQLTLSISTDRLAPSPRVDDRLREIEQDPTAIFWG
jgi:hypothetical protein